MVSAVAVTLILIGVAVLMFTGNITYTQDADALTITADYFEDLRVSYEEIDSITYEESSPTAYRTQGFGSARLSMGTFQNDALGTHTRYTYTGCDAVIVLTSGDKLLVINCKTPEQTLDLYNTLLIAINKA